jgi:hypothetical protein
MAVTPGVFHPGGSRAEQSDTLADLLLARVETGLLLIGVEAGNHSSTGAIPDVFKRAQTFIVWRAMMGLAPLAWFSEEITTTKAASLPHLAKEGRTQRGW